VSEDGQVLYDKQDMWGILRRGNLKEEKVIRVSSTKEVYYADIREVGDLG